MAWRFICRGLPHSHASVSTYCNRITKQAFQNDDAMVAVTLSYIRNWSTRAVCNFWSRFWIEKKIIYRGEATMNLIFHIHNVQATYMESIDRQDPDVYRNHPLDRECLGLFETLLSSRPRFTPRITEQWMWFTKWLRVLYRTIEIPLILTGSYMSFPGLERPELYPLGRAFTELSRCLWKRHKWPRYKKESFCSWSVLFLSDCSSNWSFCLFFLVCKHRLRLSSKRASILNHTLSI